MKVKKLRKIAILKHHVHFGTKCDFSHEMKPDREKLQKNCDFETPRAILSHETRVDHQTLQKSCDFETPRATLSHEMRVDRQILKKNCDFGYPGNPVAIAILKRRAQPFRT